MICRDCGLDESAGPFKYHVSHRFKGIHKHCHSEYSRMHQLVKKAKAFPNLYAQCDNDECGNIFSLRGGRIKACPKCKKTSFTSFKEQGSFQ